MRHKKVIITALTAQCTAVTAFFARPLRALRGHHFKRTDLYTGIFIFTILAFSSALHHYVPFGARAAVNPHELSGAIDMSPRDKHRFIRSIGTRLDKEPDSLLSFSMQEITLAFAEPDLIRADGPVQVWQYGAEDCVLDLYLDMEKAQRGAVIHYEIRPRETAYFQTPRAIGADNGQEHGHPASAVSTCLVTLVQTAGKRA